MIIEFIGTQPGLFSLLHVSWSYWSSFGYLHFWFNIMSWNNFWSKIAKFLKTNQSDSTICKEIRSTKRRKCSNMYALGTIYGPWMYYFDDENTLYIDHLHHMLYPDTWRAVYQGSLVLIHTKVRIHVYIYIFLCSQLFWYNLSGLFQQKWTHMARQNCFLTSTRWTSQLQWLVPNIGAIAR